MKKLTEDEVRDLARKKLDFWEDENVICWVWQLTTFWSLGFKWYNDRPDWRYLPSNRTFPAIILEAKSTEIELKEKQVEELKKNCEIAMTQYKKVVWVLYNWVETRVFKNNEEIDSPKELLNKEYYLWLFTENTIDKQKIYNITKKINDSLHFDFWIKNLYHRMIFTACALVAQRYWADLEVMKWRVFNEMQNAIRNSLNKSLQDSIKQNDKLSLLTEVYSDIKMNSSDNQWAIDDFIDNVIEISELVNSDYWHWEDVMWIFFNEFNRYKKKSESWQVFTPDHITSLMYRLIEVNKNDVILDAACGSWAFLVKSMCNMMNEAGWINTKKAQEIRENQLFWIEFDREIFALACANMLIHKDWKTNLEQLDSRWQMASIWMKSKPITKVLMNPPFENKYGCMNIVENVLDSVKQWTKCAFILPDKKLEKAWTWIIKRIFQHNKLEKIIKLPEKTFDAWITTSVFIFTAGIPQNDSEIFACYIAEDWLERVKNQWRQDIKDRWQEIEDKWVDIIKKQSWDETIQRIKPSEHLSYQMPKKEFEIYEKDFVKTVMDYLMFEEWIDVRKFKDDLVDKIMYDSDVKKKDDDIFISITGNKKNE